MVFPDADNFPQLPPFLSDIRDDEIRIRRRLDFGWESGRTDPGFEDTAPRFLIDGKQFSNERYDQTMVLGDVEEWTLTNTTSRIAHPFHIHINPFQVVEIHDPVSGYDYRPTADYIWRDVLAIPPSRLNPRTGEVEELGFVRIRHRFVDFPGSYVLHCHMLAHEDRGMMQLVRVIRADVDVPRH